MSIKNDIDKFNDEVVEKIEDLEVKHDEKVIEHEKKCCCKDHKKAAEHEVNLAVDETEKQNFIKKEEEKFEEAMINHDEKCCCKRDAKIEAEEKKIAEHAAKFYHAEADIEKIDSEEKK